MGVGEGSVNARWVGQPIRSMGDGRYGVLSENMGATRSKITPAYHDSPDRCLQGNVTSEPTPTPPLPLLASRYRMDSCPLGWSVRIWGVAAVL
jgi:hypothetical protein